MTAILAAQAAQVHPWTAQTILLTLATWAALFGVCYLSRPLYRQRPSVPATEPGSPDPVGVDLAEFVSNTPAFDSPYAVSPAAGDEQ